MLALLARGGITGEWQQDGTDGEEAVIEFRRVGSIPGSGTIAEEVIVVGAHMDHLGRYGMDSSALASILRMATHLTVTLATEPDLATARDEFPRARGRVSRRGLLDPGWAARSAHGYR